MVKFFFNIVNKINNDFKEHLVKIGIAISILVTVYLLSENIFLSFIISLVTAVFLLGWDSRIFIGIGLVFLLFCPFLLVFENRVLAEEMAVYAYYMFALGVFFQIIQYFKGSNFFKNKVKKTNNSETMESWSEKKVFSFVLGASLLILVVFVGCLSFFYFRIEKKFTENEKLMNDIMTTLSENEKRVAQEVADNQQEATDEEYKNNIDADQVVIANSEITISILNGSKLVGVTSKLKDKMIEQGFNIINVGDADKKDYQETIIKYSPDNLKKANIVKEYLSAKKDYQETIIKYSPDNLKKANIVKEYLSAFYENLEVLEDSMLLPDIEIILGNNK
jgi:hypothetical protein